MAESSYLVNPTRPEHEIKTEASKLKVKPAVVVNRGILMVPIENEDGSIFTMTLSLEYMGEQAIFSLVPGDIDLGTVVLRLGKNTPSESKEVLQFKNPEETEAVFLDKAVEDPTFLESRSPSR
ncbi:unnamed protein product [Orchesella dallaii]|uniref:Uncharacterized protein n=1 Tax=Orchesella dallaii TaxID=48710 RepID=A0ABP1PTI0_9HEXA